MRKNKIHAVMERDKKLRNLFNDKMIPDENVIKQKSVISESEFIESDTMESDAEGSESNSNFELIKYERSSVSNSKRSIVSKSNNSKICFNNISSAALWCRIKNYDYTSGFTLMQSYFAKHLSNFVDHAYSAYWADKLLLGILNDLLLRLTITKSLFPNENIYNKCENYKDISNVTTSVKVAIKIDDANPCLLSDWQSVVAPNSDTNQHGVFINAGSCVKKMCWAPINPDLFEEQYLAVVICSDSFDKSLDTINKHSNAIQLYCFRKLTMATMSIIPPDLEMAISHDWGRITDISWSPQPLPVVARDVLLIGHLAVACEDGIVRILPLIKQDTTSHIVKITSHPIMCLGRIDNTEGYPTCIDWCKQSPNRIAVGYSSGEIAMYFLEAGMSTDSAIIRNGNVFIQPNKWHRVFDTPIKSLQICPNKWTQVAVTSALQPHTVIADLFSARIPIFLDKTGVHGASLLWPDPGDMVVTIGGYNPNGKPGLMFHGTQQPNKTVMRLKVPTISVATFNGALNVMSIGTCEGKLQLTNFNGADVKRLLGSKTLGSNHQVDTSMRAKFCHQYILQPIEPVVEQHGPCKCALAPNCVHVLRSQYSVSISKVEDTKSNNLQLQTMVRINGIAVNPNPGMSTWLAVSLECGLIHVVPLTQFYNSEFDKITNGTCNDQLEKIAQTQCDKALLPVTMTRKRIGRPRKYPVGVNYREEYKQQRKQKKGSIKENGLAKEQFLKPVAKPRIRTRSKSFTDIDTDLSTVDSEEVEDKNTDNSRANVTTRSMERCKSKFSKLFEDSDSATDEKRSNEKVSEKTSFPITFDESMNDSLSELSMTENDEPLMDGINIIKKTTKNKANMKPIREKSLRNSTLDSFVTRSSIATINTNATDVSTKLNKPRATSSLTQLADTSIVTDSTNEKKLSNGSSQGLPKNIRSKTNNDNRSRTVIVSSPKKVVISADEMNSEQINITNDTEAMTIDKLKKRSKVHSGNKATPEKKNPRRSNTISGVSGIVKDATKTDTVAISAKRITRSSISEPEIVEVAKDDITNHTLTESRKRITRSSVSEAELNCVTLDGNVTDNVDFAAKIARDIFMKDTASMYPKKSIDSNAQSLKGILKSPVVKSPHKSTKKVDMEGATKVKVAGNKRPLTYPEDEADVVIPSKKSKKTTDIDKKIKKLPKENSRKKSKLLFIRNECTDDEEVSIVSQELSAPMEDKKSKKVLGATKSDLKVATKRHRPTKNIPLINNSEELQPDVDILPSPTPKKVSMKVINESDDSTKRKESTTKRNPRRSATVVTYEESLSPLKSPSSSPPAPKRKRTSRDFHNVSFDDSSIEIVTKKSTSNNAKSNAARKIKGESIAVDMEVTKKPSVTSESVNHVTTDTKHKDKIKIVTKKWQLGRTFNTDIDSEMDTSLLPCEAEVITKVHVNIDTTGTPANTTRTRASLANQNIDILSHTVKKTLDDIHPSKDPESQAKCLEIVNPTLKEANVVSDNPMKDSKITESPSKKSKDIDKPAKHNRINKDRPINKVLPKTIKTVEDKETDEDISTKDILSKKVKSIITDLNGEIFEPNCQSTPKIIRDVNKSSKKFNNSSSVINPPKNTKVDKKDKSKNEKGKSMVDDRKVMQLREIFSLKRQELLSEQMVVKNSVVKQASWYEGDNGKGAEEASYDVSRIDDLSITRSPCKPKVSAPATPIKATATAPVKPVTPLPNIQKILSKGALISDQPVHTSPTLLQPFRSLKPNKSFSQNDESVEES